MWEKARGFLTSMNRTLRNAIIAALIAVAVVVVIVVVYSSTRPYVTLFTDLSNEDMSAVLNILSENGVTKYEVRDNNTILVPENQENALRAAVIQQGYPSSGLAYDTYLDNIGSLSSESDRSQMSLYDLQDRLAATIRMMDGVQSAVVYITEGEDHRYILDSSDVIQASASVSVTMNGGWELDKQTAKGISWLVCNAVQGLEISNVKIVDSAGNVYAGDETGVADGDAAALKLDLEAQVNELVTDRVGQVLAPLFGKDNFSISATSTVDVSRTYKESTEYEQPDWAADGSTGGQGIIGQYIWGYDVVWGEDAAAGGVVGTTTNSDLNEYVTGDAELDGGEQEVHGEGQKDFENDEYKTQSEVPAGQITDLMVAVSINSREVDALDVQSLISHIARAAGITTEQQTDKISVLYYPFYVESAQAEIPSAGMLLPDWAIYALILGLALFLILLIVILVLSHRSKKRKEKWLADEEAARLAAIAAAREANAITPNQGADIMELNTERSMELRKDVRDFAEKNPEIAAQMIKEWLKEGGSDRG